MKIGYLIYGSSPKEILTKYAILTGKASMVPAWSFGLWLSTSFTTNYDEKTVSYFIDEMVARSCPVEGSLRLRFERIGFAN